jgi:hypothetical protein
MKCYIKSNDELAQSWQQLVRKVEHDGLNGIDVIEAQTPEGRKLEELYSEVEDEMRLYVEPSIQGNYGSVTIFKKIGPTNRDMVCVGHCDWWTFEDQTIQLALKSSNETEYKQKYKAFLEDIIRKDQDDVEYDYFNDTWFE